MPTSIPPITQNIDYVPLYPDVAGGDRVGALNRIDGSLVPVIANNIEWLRRRSGGALDITVFISLLKSALSTIQVVDEAPTGTQNGVNFTFSTEFKFVPGSLRVSFNGIILSPGVTDDFTESASSDGFIMTVAPVAEDNLLVEYLKA